ncbi:transposase IS3/IS911 family protein (plasmid) [Methylobacterium aquaticum]|uniref:Transposase IS3/IS911 family protein n=1 Tax=Methylobacterium aquaticum TaxID=270351 RepID=A0A0C6FBP0_9HYPH|nr:transposase IS3/IS911 family protein [Methylobacterium aquaticum]
MTKRTAPFSAEVRERAVRMVRDHESEHGSQWSAIQSIAAKIGCSGETPRNWVRQSARDQGVRPSQTTDERERIKALEREVRELRQANEILRNGIAPPIRGNPRAVQNDHRGPAARSVVPGARQRLDTTFDMQDHHLGHVARLPVVVGSAHVRLLTRRS